MALDNRVGLEDFQNADTTTIAKNWVATTSLLCTPYVAYSESFFRRAGDIGKIKFQNSNTGERVNTITD